MDISIILIFVKHSVSETGTSQWSGPARFKGPSWVETFPPFLPETDPVPETVCLRKTWL
jgi:hypothetical protein